MRVVVDTNILISGIFWGGTPGQVIDAWKNARFEVVVTTSIMDEYEVVLQRMVKQKGASEEIVNLTLSFIASNSIMVLPANLAQPFSADPSDEKLIAAAIGGNAGFIVSGDKALLKSKLGFPFEVITAADFVRRMR